MPLRYWRILPFKETLSGASGISRVCILSLCHQFESKVPVRKKMSCIETIAPLQCTVTCSVMFGSQRMSLIIVTRAYINGVRMTCTGFSDRHQLHPTPHWPWFRQICNARNGNAFYKFKTVDPPSQIAVNGLDGTAQASCRQDRGFDPRPRHFWKT